MGVSWAPSLSLPHWHWFVQLAKSLNRQKRKYQQIVDFASNSFWNWFAVFRAGGFFSLVSESPHQPQHQQLFSARSQNQCVGPDLPLDRPKQAESQKVRNPRKPVSSRNQIATTSWWSTCWVVAFVAPTLSESFYGSAHFWGRFRTELLRTWSEWVVLEKRKAKRWSTDGFPQNRQIQPIGCVMNRLCKLILESTSVI